MSKSRDIADSAATINYIDGLTSDAQSQIDTATSDISTNTSDIATKAPLSNPTFTGTVTATAFSGDGSALTGVDSLPSQTGNAGEFLTTDGTNPSWTPLSTSPTLEAVASGALANGDTIIVNSDGTVSAVAESDNPTWTDTANYTGTVGLYTDLLYIPNTNKVVVAFNDNSNSNYGTAIVGTFSDGLISWGAPYVFESSVVDESTELGYSPTEDKVVVFYRHNGNGNLKGRVGTISGDSISFGSATTSLDPMSSGEHLSISYDSTADKFLVCGRSTSNHLYGVVATISGTTLSYGSISVIETNSSTIPSLSYNPSENKHLVAWKAAFNNYGYIRLVTVSGTSFSVSAQNQFTTTSLNKVRTAYEADSGTVVMVYYTGATSDVFAKAVDMSSTSGTFGSEVTIDSASSSYIAATSNNNDKIYAAYSSKIAPLTVSGTTITVGTPTTYSGTTYLAIDLAYNSLSDNYVALWTPNGGSYDGLYNIFTATETSLTEENYIGISDAAYSDGATAKIQLVGSVDDAQTGLTAGQQYYIAKNGDLSLSPSAVSVVAGTAVSATKLIVKG